MWLAVGAACESKPAATPGSGSAPGPGSAGSAVAVASGSGSAIADAAIEDASVDAAVDVDAGSAAACVPLTYQLARVGADLVLCGDDPLTCFTIDPATGKATPRAAAHPAGYSFSVERKQLPKPNCYEELCWAPPAPQGDSAGSADYLDVVYHPDGKRAVIFDAPDVHVFDLATKQRIATFEPKLGNSPMAVWFTRELVLVKGVDAGPYGELAVHRPDGKFLRKLTGLFEGDVGIAADGRPIVQEAALSSLTVLDGKSGKGKAIRRKVPKGACGDVIGLDPDDGNPKTKACLESYAKYYGPYADATIVDEGTGFVGAHGNSLFHLDAKLDETSSVLLSPMCPPAKDDAPPDDAPANGDMAPG